MRVLMMLTSLRMGGAERNVVSVLPYLKSAGVTPLLGTLNTRRDSALAQTFAETGIPRLDVDAKRMTDPGAWRRFSQLLHEEKIDIIHAEDQDTILYGGLARWRLKKPTVMTRHVLQEPGYTVKRWLRAKLVLFTARYSLDRVIAVSEAVRQQFLGQTGAPASKIKTIYNGIDIERFDTRGQREAKRAEMGWAGNNPVVIMVAVLRLGKGHDVLFKAIPPLKALIPSVKVKLVGDGKLEDDLRQEAAPFGDTVEFLGQRMDVPELLGASDVLILPSWSEALPTVLIEAGAAALPVVATDVGGTKEIVEDGKGGFIISPGQASALVDKLAILLQNPAQALELGRNARERVVRLFSLKQQAQQTIALYEEVLSKT